MKACLSYRGPYSVIFTLQGRLLLCRLLQEGLQTLQDVLLPQEVKDFLCIVLQGQAFPGDRCETESESH